MKTTRFVLTIFIYLVTLTGCITTGKMNTTAIKNKHNQPRYLADNFLEELFKKYPLYFDTIQQNKDLFKVQVIYTQIDREKKNKIRFSDHSFNLTPNEYFYPASTVKFPVAILALQRLNELRIAGLDKNSTMLTGENGDGQTSVQNDPSSADGRPTIAHYIKKILLVSDNDAFNRLYEFLGQEYINDNLHRMGYRDAEIIHRLSITLTEAQNRHTNPIRFMDGSGKLLYEQPAVKSKLRYITRDTAYERYRMGKGFIRGETLVHEPFDFSLKNRLQLMDLHQMVRSIMFPQTLPAEKRFKLSPQDYEFLRTYMSMRPGESVSPTYDTSYWDNYVKMIFYGTEKTTPEPGIRIFNKTGTAYGFLTETCYFADFNNHIEFMLSAVIYCNSDGIFNDDRYDYANLGYPFLKNLGRVIYAYEKQRKRKNKPDLSTFQFQYD